MTINIDPGLTVSTQRCERHLEIEMDVKLSSKRSSNRVRKGTPKRVRNGAVIHGEEQRTFVFWSPLNAEALVLFRSPPKKQALVPRALPAPALWVHSNSVQQFCPLALWENKFSVGKPFCSGAGEKETQTLKVVWEKCKLERLGATEQY